MSEVEPPLSLKVSSEFIQSEGIHLEIEDLGYGFQRGYISALEAVKYASATVGRGSPSASMLELSLILSSNIQDAERMLTPYVLGGKNSQGTWLYLQLKAAYLALPHEGQLVDDVLEQIYADFDYPEIMSPLAGYSTARARNRKPLREEWKTILNEMHRALKGS